jgi:hypothetical protein
MSGTAGMPLRERLEFYSIPEPNTGCTLWIGALFKTGYGKLSKDGKYKRAHRLAYELARGPIPSGLQIDHLCRVRSCVNVAHMEVVTNRQNTLRGVGRTAVNARKTHCLRGHEFTPQNTYRYANNQRTCRICFLKYCAGYRAKHRERINANRREQYAKRRLR